MLVLFNILLKHIIQDPTTKLQRVVADRMKTSTDNYNIVMVNTSNDSSKQAATNMKGELTKEMNIFK